MQFPELHPKQVRTLDLMPKIMDYKLMMIKTKHFMNHTSIILVIYPLMIFSLVILFYLISLHWWLQHFPRNFLASYCSHQHFLLSYSYQVLISTTTSLWTRHRHLLLISHFISIYFIFTVFPPYFVFYYLVVFIFIHFSKFFFAILLLLPE